MVPKIIAHSPVKITKPQKVVLFWGGVCLGVFNGMKDQIIQRKTAIQDIEVSPSYYYYYYYCCCCCCCCCCCYIFIFSRIIKIEIKTYNNFVLKIDKTNKSTTWSKTVTYLKGSNPMSLSREPKKSYISEKHPWENLTLFTNLEKSTYCICISNQTSRSYNS